MSTERTSPTASITELWNDKCALAREIEKLIRPFADKYAVTLDQVEVGCTYHGVFVKVIL